MVAAVVVVVAAADFSRTARSASLPPASRCPADAPRRGAKHVPPLTPPLRAQVRGNLSSGGGGGGGEPGFEVSGLTDGTGGPIHTGRLRFRAIYCADPEAARRRPGPDP